MLSFQFHLDLIALGKLSYEQNMDTVMYDTLLCRAVVKRLTDR